MKQKILSITLGIITGTLLTGAAFFGADYAIPTKTIQAPPAVILDVEQSVVSQEAQESVSPKTVSQKSSIEDDLPPVDSDTQPTRVVSNDATEEHRETSTEDGQSADTSNAIVTSETETETDVAVAVAVEQKKAPIIIVISDLGLSQQSTTQALALPAAFTLAFPTYADQLGLWIQKARELKHDTLLSTPMEPRSYPQDDPGPNSLLLSLPDAENIRRLNEHLAKAGGYVGIATHMGTGFLASKEKLTPVLEDLGQKRLMILETEKTSETILGALARAKGLPYHAVDRMIDADLNPKSINASLDFLVATAKDKGFAIGMTRPYPAVLETLKAWSKNLGSFGVELAPLSALDK